MSLFLTCRPATVDTRQWVNSRPAQALVQLNQLITLPTFSVSGLPALAESVIVARFTITTSAPFSVLNWNDLTPSSNYVLAVTNPFAAFFDEGPTVVRRKFWSVEGVIPEVVKYSGSTVGVTAGGIFEVWTVPGITSFTFPTTQLTISILENATPNSVGPTTYTGVVDYNLFAALPAALDMQFTQPLV